MQESEFRQVVKQRLEIVGMIMGQCDPYTICAMIARYGGVEYAAVGFAKRMDMDERNDAEGACIAKKKAHRDIVDQICMEREARELLEF